jgi:hypothetical protein
MSSQKIMNWVQALTFPSLVLFAPPIMRSAQAQMPYDGNWNVTIETKSGNCDQVAHFHLSVLDGRVFGPEDVFGKIGKEGSVKVSLKGAYANGQLFGNAGSGRWNAASAGKPCSGRWEATKEWMDPDGHSRLAAGINSPCRCF